MTKSSSNQSTLHLNDTQLKQSLHISALLATTLPPFVGGSVMALIGFYPVEHFYAIYTNLYVLLYVISAIGLMQFWALRTGNVILQLTQQEQMVAEENAKRLLVRLPWFFIIVVTFYSMGGVYSADLAFESMGIRNYTSTEHLINQLGLIPVVIITVFPIYFFLIDRIARYLGPHGIVINAHPLWVKVFMLGLVTPLLIDSVIVGYYVNHTGHFGLDTVILWSSLLLVAIGGTLLAWRSLRQGLLPLQKFVEISDPGKLPEHARSLLIPLSMDELGVLTSRYLELIERNQQSSLLADAVMENAGALVIVLDHQGRIVRFNRACEELSGYSYKEVAGKYPWETVLPPEDADKIRQNAFEAWVKNPESFAGNYTNDWLAKSGERYRLDWANRVLCNNLGQMEYMVSIGINVTEQHKAEEELRTSNQVINAVLDTTPVLIAYLDPQMNFIRVNKAYASADNKEPEYFIGKNHFALFPHDENESIFNQVVETGEAYTVYAKPFEYDNNPERGVSHWDWTLTPIKDSEGKVNGLVLSLLDVTERIEALETIQRSEQELKRVNESLETRVEERTAELQDVLSLNQQMLSSLAIGVTAYNENGDCIFANEAMARIINAKQENVLAQNFRSIQSWHDYGLLPLAVKALEEGAIQHGEFHVITTFGREAWLDVTFARFDRRGKPHLLFLASDITDRKKAEQEIINARDEAEKANQAKNDFLSRMSHELRTPMNAILGFTQVLEMEPLEPKQLQFVGEIHQAGEHLLTLINELLDLSRIESGKLNISLEQVFLNSVVVEAMKLVEEVFKEHEVTFNNQCANNLELVADPNRLRQVLVNLFTNAAKYNHKGGSITLHCESHRNDKLRIIVSDTGPGIAKDKLEDLFVPFERLGAELGEVDGTGIGLALSKQLVELMGGTIGVDTILDKGSAFWVELPIGESEPIYP